MKPEILQALEKAGHSLPGGDGRCNKIVWPRRFWQEILDELEKDGWYLYRR